MFPLIPYSRIRFHGKKNTELRRLQTPCKLIGGRDECLAYIKEHGGQLYTQVDGDEDYEYEDGYKTNIIYAKGDRWVNRTGVYGVV